MNNRDPPFTLTVHRADARGGETLGGTPASPLLPRSPTELLPSPEDRETQASTRMNPKTSPNGRALRTSNKGLGFDSLGRAG